MRTALRLATVKPRYWLEEQLYRRSGDPSSVATLRDRYLGSPLLIVGNGPSLNETPLDELQGMPSIGMNKIDLIYGRTEWRPSLVVSVNSSVIRQHHPQLAEAGIPVWLPRKARYFVPTAARSSFHWFHLRPDAGFSTDLTEGAGFGATVTYTALQFAYWLGADPVVIVGVDHSFDVADKKPNQYETLSGADRNHFDPGYFANQKWAIPDLEVSEANYRAAREAFAADGRNVLDATVGGKLTVFDKIDIGAAIRIAEAGS